ncbi:MAG: hypothetical protein IPK52_24230 [Chloroflexi bacterium]|nr:hypothetical protein [Chloroflexota bacterium]
MTDEKQKNQNYKTEFSFSFNNLAERVSTMLGSIGEEPEMASFSEKVGDETSAKIDINGGIGKLHLHPGENPALLAQVETRHVGKMLFSAISDGTGSKTVKIENQVMKGGVRGIVGGFGKKDLFIDIALAPGLPLNVDVDSGVGESLLDLRGLHVADFKLEGGVGPSTVYLPDGDYKISIEGGVGPCHIHLPASSGNKARVEGGVGPMNLTVAENADATLEVEGGVGPANINVPAGSPLMIEFESGLGPLNRPAGLVQKSQNVWHTEGYDLAERSVYVKVKGGIGPVRVTFVTPDGEPLPGEKSKRKNDFV